MAETVKKQAYSFGLGRRKTATARVRLISNGKGNITVNGKSAADYFQNDENLVSKLAKPFELTSKEGSFDVSAMVLGGGKSAQADAINLGVSKCLAEIGEEMKSTLKRAAMLKRDPRMKERKKPGLRGARRAEQFSKR
jgi:small subunit ribosomal protein S9